MLVFFFFLFILKLIYKLNFILVNETLYNTRRAGWNTEEILKHQMDADRYLG